MNNNPYFRVFLLFVTCCLSAPHAMANPPGDGGIEIWVDGPDEVQPGGNASFPDAAVGPQGRSIFVWEGENLEDPRGCPGVGASCVCLHQAD